MIWSNEIPKSNGYFWLYEQIFIDEIEQHLKHGPETVTLEVVNEGSDPYVLARYIASDTEHTIKSKEGKLINDYGTFLYPNRKVVYWWIAIEEPMFHEKLSLIPYPLTEQKGVISLEQDFVKGAQYGNVGIQIARDGRIWLCLDGGALIRFKPSEHNPFDNGIEKPYIINPQIMVNRDYNPNYGDHRLCKCSHTYYRHFDSYDQMTDAGCKYCRCHTFEEDPNSNNCIKKKDE